MLEKDERVQRDFRRTMRPAFILVMTVSAVSLETSAFSKITRLLATICLKKAEKIMSRVRREKGKIPESDGVELGIEKIQV